MRAVITGGTGLIGRSLCARIPDTLVLTRAPERAVARFGDINARRWNPDEPWGDESALAGSDAVFHLAGESVAGGRWTEARKRRIRESRVLGTRHLVAGLAALPEKPKVLVCASAVGIYGDRGDEPLDEDSTPGDGFLAGVCEAWEQEAMKAAQLGVRVVCARIGVVLAADGGALTRMMPAFRMGLGGRIASGRQWMPWIHVDDVAGLLLLAAEQSTLRGPINCVAPDAVRNLEFTRALGRAVGRPALVPVPELALRLAVGEMSQVLTASQRVLPRKAQAHGYDYRYPDLDGALRSASRAEAA